MLSDCANFDSSDSSTEDFDCDGLNDDQCDLLKSAQGAAGTAVAGK